MGFFDRFASKKPNTPSPGTPSVAEPDAGNGSPPSAATPAAGIKPQLALAREKLEEKDLAGAVAIYEELLRSAGNRADVLVTLSGDLGSCGYVDQIVELVAPCYDAELHGPATGLNLLQAYLATHNTDAAQHLLDILFALNRPELQVRLHGFSNALAELLEAERRGALSQAPRAGGPAAPGSFVSLASISKPIWAYGLETIPGLLPIKEERLRRVAFAQLALLDQTDLAEDMKKPEDEFGRFCRGFPLWMAESFYFSPPYSPIAAIGTMNKEHYMMFGTEWTTTNIRELVDTASAIDYVFTGALRHQSEDFELTLKVWEVRRFRERKAFTARWTPSTADAELTKLAETIRMFMEWTAYPAGAALAYAPTLRPREYCDTLGTSLSLFLTDKGVLPKSHLEPITESLPRIAARAVNSELASLTYLTALDRASRLGLIEAARCDAALFASPIVDQAKEFLSL